MNNWITNKKPGRFETVLLSISTTDNKKLVTTGGYDYQRKEYVLYDNGNMIKSLHESEYIEAWQPLPLPYNGGINE